MSQLQCILWWIWRDHPCNLGDLWEVRLLAAEKTIHWVWRHFVWAVPVRRSRGWGIPFSEDRGKCVCESGQPPWLRLGNGWSSFACSGQNGRRTMLTTRRSRGVLKKVSLASLEGIPRSCFAIILHGGRRFIQPGNVKATIIAVYFIPACETARTAAHSLVSSRWFVTKRCPHLTEDSIPETVCWQRQGSVRMRVNHSGPAVAGSTYENEWKFRSCAIAENASIFFLLRIVGIPRCVNVLYVSVFLRIPYIGLQFVRTLCTVCEQIFAILDPDSFFFFWPSARYVMKVFIGCVQCLNQSPNLQGFLICTPGCCTVLYARNSDSQFRGFTTKSELLFWLMAFRIGW